MGVSTRIGTGRVTLGRSCLTASVAVSGACCTSGGRRGGGWRWIPYAVVAALLVTRGGSSSSGDQTAAVEQLGDGGATLVYVAGHLHPGGLYTDMVVSRDGPDPGGTVRERRERVNQTPSEARAQVLAQGERRERLEASQACDERKQREVAAASFGDRVAVQVTRFAGSMGFVYLHIAFFGFWIIANLGLIGPLPRWDPSFVVLAIYVATEATLDLIDGDRPAVSWVGIGLAVVTLLTMPPLAVAKRRVGQRLGSAATTSESRQTMLCSYMAGALLVGAAILVNVDLRDFFTRNGQTHDAMDISVSYKIERRGDTSWSITLYEPIDGPWRLLNTTPITLSGSVIIAEFASLAEAKAWIAANAPKQYEEELRKASLGRSALKGVNMLEVAKAWQKKKADAGWACLHWPKEYGGPGWTITRRFVFEQEEGARRVRDRTGNRTWQPARVEPDGGLVAHETAVRRQVRRRQRCHGDPGSGVQRVVGLPQRVAAPPAPHVLVDDRHEVDRLAQRLAQLNEERHVRRM